MLNRWDPFAEIARLQDQMFRPLAREERPTFAPPVDIYEDNDAIFVKAELPAVKPEDLHVFVENDVLTVRGERKLEKEDKRDGYHRIERSYGTFTRSFALPKTVDGEKVECNLDAGVLTIKIPKRTAPEPRKIEVKSGPAASLPKPGTA